MDQSISFIIVDDQLLDRLAVEQYAAAYPGLKHLGSFSDSGNALTAIKAIQPSLIFLDIDMPGISGLDVLREVKSFVPMAVFITGHPEFALEGFELSAMDFIVKPLTAARFGECMRRVKEYWEMKNKAELFEVAFETDSFTIKEGYNHVKLRKSDIIYLEAMQDYTKIVTAEKTYMTLSSLTHFLEKFPGTELIRVHRSYAVAANKITAIKNNEILCNAHMIPVGKTFKQQIALLKK